MLTRTKWERDIQRFEANWWGDCANTYGEESKQIAYARVMELDPGTWRGGDHWPIWDFGNKKVLDIGGGPSSMLLKSGFGTGVVVDPCPYPSWVADRYKAHGIEYVMEPAEELLPREADGYFDLALIYNCLQHTMDPEAILRGMRRVAKEVRIFEWVDMPAHPGHPQELHAREMADWLGEGRSRHVWLDEQYNEIGPESDSPVRQHGWGGVFGG